MQRTVIFSAPSGSGKTTIVRHLLRQMENLTFAISATTRPRREGEVDGRDYYYLSLEEFKQRAINNEFVEYEEVYNNTFYGTLHSELERLWQQGKQVIFDVDVYGGMSLKKVFGKDALLVFIMPPSLDALRQRLEERGTEPPSVIAERIAKAENEIAFAPKFDITIINDNLQTAIAETRSAIEFFFNS
jgi:guanylate kinase